MPPKITPKNLSYDTTLPPFLQKLQNNYDRGVEGRDGRHENALLRVRPKRARNAEEEEEDEPVYVDEEGNVVGKEGLVEEGVKVEGEDDGEKGGGEKVEEEDEKDDTISNPKAKENLVSIGKNTKKRRIGKVIGDDMDTDPIATTSTSTSTTTATKSTKTKKVKSSTSISKPGFGKAPRRPVMSFGDEELGDG